MKKILRLILILSLVFIFSACTGEEESTTIEPPTSPAEEPALSEEEADGEIPEEDENGEEISEEDLDSTSPEYEEIDENDELEEVNGDDSFEEVNGDVPSETYVYGTPTPFLGVATVDYASEEDKAGVVKT